MAKKHIKEFYQKIYDQFIEYNNLIKEFSVLTQTNMIDDNMLEDVTKNWRSVLENNRKKLDYIVWTIEHKSVKDVVKMHIDESNNLAQMCDCILEMERAIKEEGKDPSCVEQIKTLTKGMEVSTKKLNFIVYLLNMPKKKSKQKWYKRQYINRVKNSITDKDIFAENQVSIDKLKNLIKELSNSDQRVI